MKYIFCIIALIVLVAPASAGFSTTFQNTADFTEYVACAGYFAGTSCSYYQNTTGGNSYITTQIVNPSSDGSYGIQNLDPELTTYASASLVYLSKSHSSNGVAIVLKNSAGAELYSYVDSSVSSSVHPDTRYEVVVTAGTARVYKNEMLLATSPVLVVNPSYINFGAYSTSGAGKNSYAYWDDFVYGSGESKYIFSAPKEGAYILKKDMVSAASGFAWNNGTIISSYNMTTTWGKETNTSQTIILQNYGTGQAMCSYATETGNSAGLIQWPLEECIFNNPLATYGYYVTTISGSGQYSGVIPYLGSGASVAFNSGTYTTGDTATVSYSILGGYWDTGTYTYKIQTQDVFGNIWETNTITTQTGSVSVDFTDAPQGVYYAIAIATPIAGGDEIWMAYDSTEVSGYMSFYGTISDAENATAITSNVTVSIVQGITSDTTYTTTGSYSSTTGVAFGTGATTTFTVSASGYQDSVTSFTPMIAKTIAKNITMVRSAPTCPVGICLGGLANETVYSRPVPYVTISITNATHGESYSTSTNFVGWYNVGESDGIFFTNGRCYNVTASKSGYTGNSYLKCVVGT